MLVYFGLIFAVLASLLSSFSNNYTYLLDSDIANIYFAALDMNKGNVFLRDWYLPPDSFWLLDIAGMATLIKICGGSSNIPSILAAIWLAAVSGFSVLLSARLPAKLDWRRVFPPVLFISLIPIFLRTPVSYLVYAPYHIGTMAVSLAGLIVVQNIFLGKHNSLNGFVLFCLSLIILSSDFFGFVVFLFPLLLVGFLCFLEGGQQRRSCYVIYAAIFFSWLASCFLKYLVASHSGFVSAKLTTSFVPIEKIPEKFLYTIKSFLDFFGVDFFGPPEQFFIALVRMIPFLTIFIYFKINFSTYVAAKRFFCECDRISQIMIIGVCINLFVAFFSNFGVEKSDIIRYFFSIIYLFCDFVFS